MNRRALCWVSLVFGLTLLAELPASWLVVGMRLPAQGVSGTLWQGQVLQVADVGPIQWRWRPWQRNLHIRLGFQGQAWQLGLGGWPWHWQAELQALGAQHSVAAGYRLAGQWQGRIDVQGAGFSCQRATGSIMVTDLAMREPWSLALGHGSLVVACAKGVHAIAQLSQDGQHQLRLEADLTGRSAQVDLELQADAALIPVLRAGQWLGEDSRAGRKTVRW
jgi:general secretion pathway protein N